MVRKIKTINKEEKRLKFILPSQIKQNITSCIHNHNREKQPKFSKISIKFYFNLMNIQNTVRSLNIIFHIINELDDWK